MPKFLERLNAVTRRLGFEVLPRTIYQNSSYQMGAKGISAGVDLGSDPLAIWRPGGSKTIPASKAMDQNTGWVYASVHAIADEVSNISFRLFQIDNNGDHVEKFDHELLDLLDGVNDFQTGPELKYLIAAHLKLAGNAYLLLEGVKNFDDQPNAIFTLNPGNMKIVLDKTVYPYKVDHYEYTIDGRKFKYKPYEIVHIKSPDPSDPYMGIGTVQNIAMWIDNDNYAMEYNRKFFINGARIDGVLETQNTTDSEIMSLKTSFESSHAGVENAYKTPVLPKGVVFKPMQATAKDMDFAKLLDTTRDRILAGFRVSKTILGTAESDTNRATAETADYVFAKRTIKPLMTMIVSYLNERLVPRFGDDIYLSFIDPTPEDKQYRIKEMQAAIGNQPVMSVNEAREAYLGLGPIDNGDEVMVSSTMNGIGTPSKENTGEKPKKAVSKKNGKPSAKKRIIKTRFAKNAEIRKGIVEILAEKVAASVLKINEKPLHKMDKVEYATVYQKFAERVTEYESEIRKAVVKINHDQQKEVEKNLGKFMGDKTQKATVPDMFNLENWIQVTTDALTPILTELYGKEGASAAEAYGLGKFDTNTEAAKRALDNAVSKLAKSYNETTMAQLKSKISEGLANGESLAQIKDTVAGIYEFADTNRASLVATTETFRVANEATKEGWRQTGVVKTIRWYTAEDEKVCQYCWEQDGKSISIDDNFYDNGDTVPGVDGGLMDVNYGDVGAPPLHPDCRCYVQPDEVSID